MPFLRTLAAAGGGSIVTSPLAAWQNNLARVFDQQSLTWLLWLLALLLLPIDIGVRRLIVDRHDLAVVWAALPLHRQRRVSEEPAVPTLDTVRLKRARGRAGARPVGAPVMEPSTTVRTSIQAGTAPPPPAPPQSSGGENSPAEDSTAGRLLASKRKRR
jgi:hypothetical protein